MHLYVYICIYLDPHTFTNHTWIYAYMHISIDVSVGAGTWYTGRKQAALQEQVLAGDQPADDWSLQGAHASLAVQDPRR